MDQKKRKDDYIKLISVGNVVAFKSNENLLSGKVLSILDGTYTIRTKNGSIFYVNSDNLVWLKTGSTWPIGIANALKFNKI